jgi:papain like protease
LTDEVGRSGVVAPCSTSFFGGHGITIVGSRPAEASYRFANSWGTGWGESGFGTLTAEVMERLQEVNADFGVEMHAVDAD